MNQCKQTPLHESTDGYRWASEFCAANIAIDMGLMLAWFCNAIEAGRAAGQREAQARTQFDIGKATEAVQQAREEGYDAGVNVANQQYAKQTAERELERHRRGIVYQDGTGDQQFLSLTDPIDKALLDVTREYAQATEKFPVPFHSAHEGLAVIEEEFIELRDEVFRNPLKNFKNCSQGFKDRRIAIHKRDMRKEAIQLAAMALKFLTQVVPDADTTGVGRG